MRNVFALVVALSVACSSNGERPNNGSAAITAVEIAKPADDMVTVGAGWFSAGCNELPADALEYDAHDCAYKNPPRRLWLASFAVDTLEVTFAQYERCVAAGVCRSPSKNTEVKEAHPSNPVLVPFEQAENYCHWVGKRLPTEAEWEKAARGSDDGRAYPWGNRHPECAFSVFSSDRLAHQLDPKYNVQCERRFEAVGIHPGDTSPYGAMDMAGNAAEWTANLNVRLASWERPDATGPLMLIDSASVDPRGPTEHDYFSQSAEDRAAIPKHVLRGGREEPSIAARNPGPHGQEFLEGPNDLGEYVGGFRCARSEKGPPPPTDAKPHAKYKIELKQTPTGFLVTSLPLD